MFLILVGDYSNLQTKFKNKQKQGVIMSKTYIVTAEIELEVLDCENEESAIAHAEWRVSQPDFDFDFQAEEVDCTKEGEDETN
jgi:hypothetical protein